MSWTTHEPADGRVEYGLTAGYGRQPLRNQPDHRPQHRLDRAGLRGHLPLPRELRQRRGHRTTSPDHTFTTGSCGSGGATGDEFGGSALDTSVWHVHDPLGDSTVSVGSGRLHMSVPAGVSHDLWPGALHSPRVLRGAGNGDFEIEAKYDSVATQTAQGILALGAESWSGSM